MYTGMDTYVRLTMFPLTQKDHDLTPDTWQNVKEQYIIKYMCIYIYI